MTQFLVFQKPGTHTQPIPGKRSDLPFRENGVIYPCGRGAKNFTVMPAGSHDTGQIEIRFHTLLLNLTPHHHRHFSLILDQLFFMV